MLAAQTAGRSSTTDPSSAGCQGSTTGRPASKVQVWPRPNYLALVQRGHHPVNVMILRQLYAGLPTKTKAKFQNSQSRLMDAIAAFRDASLEWLEQAAAPSPARLTKLLMQDALFAILARAFGAPASSDPCYFSRRHVVDRAGCMLFALLADAPPHRLLPTLAKIDLASVELARGWPTPLAPWERRSMFIVTKDSVSVETRAGATFARWPASMAPDKGVFQTFDDREDALEWQEGLEPVLVLTDKPSTRLVATHPDRERAMAALV